MTSLPSGPLPCGSDSLLPVSILRVPSRARRRCFRAVLTGIGLAGALAAPAAATPATVTVANKQFGPSAVTVVAGESVTWNFTEASHDVAGAGWSGNPAFGTGTFTRVFPTAGTFSYVCEAHSNMQGTVAVTAAAALPVPAGPVAPAPPVAPVPTAPVPALADVLAPSLGSARVWLPRSMTRPRLNVHLSEDARIAIVIRRVGARNALPRLVRRAVRGANHFVLDLGALRKGRYRVRITAADAAGNASRLRRATLVVAARH